MALSFAPAAVQDIEEIGDYIRAENPPAARLLIAALRVRCGTILDAPRGGAPRSELYVIFYTIDGDDVRVERILHGSHPGHFR